MEEELKAFHESIAKFKKEDSSAFEEEMSMDEFNKLDDNLKAKIALFYLHKRQEIERVELFNSQHSDKEEENLLLKHQQEEEEFSKKQYALDDSTNINKNNRYDVTTKYK